MGWHGLGQLVVAIAVIVLVTATPATAQGNDARQRADEIDRLFAPPVVRLAGESRVVGSARLDAVCETAEQRAVVERWLVARGVVVLDKAGPGLTLHVYAQGIAPMSAVDRLWEGLPRRAESLQDLIDHAITRARAERRPITQLIIAGHAGLPGCAALGGTLDDCVFRGKLSDYQRRQLARLRPYLADDAEIELRQCVTGQGNEGQRLLTALHQITGATISSYLADFHFGDSAKHPRVRFNSEGLKIVGPDK